MIGTPAQRSVEQSPTSCLAARPVIVRETRPQTDCLSDRPLSNLDCNSPLQTLVARTLRATVRTMCRFDCGARNANRVRAPVRSAWLRVCVFAKTTFRCARTVPILMSRSSAISARVLPDAIPTATSASARVRSKACVSISCGGASHCSGSTTSSSKPAGLGATELGATGLGARPAASSSRCGRMTKGRRPSRCTATD